MQRVYEDNEWGKVSKRIVTHRIPILNTVTDPDIPNQGCVDCM